MLHATTAGAFGLNFESGVDGNGSGTSSNVTAHVVDGLLNMRVVSVETLHDLAELEDLQHASSFVTYVQHSAVVEQLNRSCVGNEVCNKPQRRQQLFKIPNRMTELLSRVTANLNCYNNAQRHRRQRQKQRQEEEVPSPEHPEHQQN